MTREAYERGQQAWRDGADMPPTPPGDIADEAAMFWVGFMFERARDFFKRQRMALYPDRVEPRP